MRDQLASTTPELEGSSDPAPSDSKALVGGLVRRHFARQKERPRHLRDVELSATAPSLRNLLFTDGTVTRTLEARALSRVTVNVVSQSRCSVTSLAATQLEVPSETDSVQRRVTIGFGGYATPLIWAESYILPERLPASFLSVLGDTPDGIGESLQQMQLEGWREMLWFGLDSPPAWDDTASEAAETFLTRLYRVIAQGRPALLIAESFAVEEQAGYFRLADSG